MYCNKCGTQNQEEASFCSKCGSKLNSTAIEATPKKEIQQITPSSVLQLTQKQKENEWMEHGKDEKIVEDGTDTSYNAKYARFGRRFAALMVDSIIVIFMGGILGFIIDFVYNMNGWSKSNIGFLFLILFFVLLIMYEAVMMSSFRQATIGKIAFGMIVTDLNGNRISFDKALIRAIASNIIPFYWITILFTEKKQGLHDFIAGTLVIMNKNLSCK